MDKLDIMEQAIDRIAERHRQYNSGLITLEEAWMFVSELVYNAYNVITQMESEEV